MTSFITTTKMTDRSVAASCTLGSSTLLALTGTGLPGTGLSAICADSPVLLGALPVSERNERRTKAPVAVLAAEAQAHGAYAFAAAAGAGYPKTQTKKQHHLMWAYRGLEPWSDPV
ncbi:hypothetical protein OG730_14670 [Streptomyces sp. NBC_01298]|uniref:hypothetical protein n=1 Tax=Streptomyces sp. NBC_01298 TaxID=2903817 RepID=UPI002E167271|nr:hypothetical protein OG730_14670 [Streptomyces sp. NBC_01298]